MPDLLGEVTGYAASGVWLPPIKGLLAAFVFGQMLAWTYELTYRGLSYSRGFAHSVTLACVASTILVLSLSHSVIAGIGLLGVLSMVRFRVNLKASRDLVFIMGAATIGVAAGVGALLAATAGTVSFCAVAIYLHGGSFASRARYDGVLRFRLSTDDDSGLKLKALLDEFCHRRMLLSIGEVAQGSVVERAYQVKLWKTASAEELVSRLRSELHAVNARLLLQEATLEY